MVKVCDTKRVMVVFRDRLVMTLNLARVSQSELARLSGLGQPHLNAICAGRVVHVTAETVVRIARVLGCSTDWLLGLTARGPAPQTVRHAVASSGGRVIERPGEMHRDPINLNAGSVSRRGRARRVRSVVLPPDAPSEAPDEADVPPQ
jgi:transcriptional regulator with XRE-family HTH domain